MKKILGYSFFSIFLVCIVIFPFKAFSAEGWHPIGPYGGAINSISISQSSPSLLFVTLFDERRVFKTTNGGEEWKEIIVNNDDKIMERVVIDPQDNNVLYALTNETIFKSNDGGNAWREIDNGVADWISSLAINPFDTQTIYLGTGWCAPAVGCGGGKIYKSTDAGTTWTEKDNGLNEGRVNTILFSPDNPQTVFAGTTTGLYKTENGGDTWTLIEISGIGANETASIHDIEISSASADIIFAIVNDGLFKTENGGKDWSNLTNNFNGEQVLDIAITDNALTAFVLTDRGLYRSMDGGASWSKFDNKQEKINFNKVVVAPGESNTVYAGSLWHGVFKSIDNGNSWTAKNYGINALSIECIAVDSDKNIYAGTQRAIYKSVDAGKNWLMVSREISVGTVKTLIIDPNNSSIVYAGVQIDPFGGNETEGGLFKTVDGGATWLKIAPYNVNSIAVDPKDSSKIYIGTENGVYIGTDSGTNWYLSVSGMDQDHIYITHIIIDPNDTSLIYAIGGATLYKSNDAGVHWTKIESGLPTDGINLLKIDPKNSNVLYLGFSQSGLYKSTDGGATWNSINNGVIDNGNGIDISGLEIDMQDSNVLYLSTNRFCNFWTGECTEGNVYKSINGGDSWQELNNGLTSREISCLSGLFDGPGYLYAGTMSNGIFEYEIGYQKGDANGDGQINVLDVISVINMILNPNSSISGNADCNGDGTVNVLDVICVINKILHGS